MGIRNVGVWPAALILLAAASEGAFAQEVRGSSPGSARGEVRANGPGDNKFLIDVEGRVTIPTGTVDPDLNANYGDLFKTGFGVAVEGTYLFRIAPQWSVGPYLSVGWDSFDGKTFTDDFGDTLTPDKMDVTTFLVGVRALLDMGQTFQLDLHMGLGAAHYSKVDGVAVLSGVPLDVVVFKSSTAFAWDLGSRFVANAGPVFFDAGIDLRVQGAPKNQDFDFSSGPMVNFSFEFGIGVRF